jgi:single-stranded-DNA-specific exonuclease
MNKLWNVHNIDLKETERISEKFNIPRIVSSIVATKNLKDSDIEKYLNPTRKDFYDPYLLPDIEKALDRIEEAIQKNEKICIYGDYDADGITSTTILKRFFAGINIDVGTYIPNRLDEGYGLNEAAIRDIANEKYNLIITVDCGITAIDDVKLAKDLGMDVIVTDHHEPLEEIPDCIAVIDCKRKDSKYPFRELAGCGVAFKLAQAICKRKNLNEDEALKFLDIVCIGTISDIVPLQDENRVITKLGLKLVEQTKNVGLRALINETGFKKIDSGVVAFGISPRINACGRMGHQEIALKLFLTDDPIEARKLASELEKYNKQRQNIEKRIFQEADQMAEKEKDRVSLILGHEDWHKGVIGIVSSKITDKYFKPSILIDFEGEDAKGSGRSVPGFDIHEALGKCNTYLKTYGGHSMAIGLSLKKSDFEKFKNEFEEYAKEKVDTTQVPEIYIDSELNNKELTKEEIRALELLEPYGEANEEPVFIIKNMKIDSIRTLSEGKHLKLTLKDENNISLEAIGFNLGEEGNKYRIGDKIDIVGNLKINEFNGFENIQLTLRDLRTSL